MNRHKATIGVHTFVRSSQNRVYTNCVVIEYSVPLLREWKRKDAARQIEQDRQYYAKHAEGHVSSYVYPTDVARQAAIAKAKEWLSVPVDARLHQRLVDFDRAHERNTEGVIYSCAGWCGRYELAQKLAQSQRTHYQAEAIRRVHILDVEVQS